MHISAVTTVVNFSQCLNQLLLLCKGLLVYQCTFTKCLEEEEISLTVAKVHISMNRDFSNKDRKKGQVLEIYQLTGISWNMHRALLHQKDMLLHYFYLSSGKIVSPKKMVLPV